MKLVLPRKLTPANGELMLVIKVAPTGSFSKERLMALLGAGNAVRVEPASAKVTASMAATLQKNYLYTYSSTLFARLPWLISIGYLFQGASLILVPNYFNQVIIVKPEFRTSRNTPAPGHAFVPPCCLTRG